MIFVFLFLTYFTRIIGCRFIHPIRTDSYAFLFLAGKYSIAHMYHNFFISSSIDGHLGFFHVLAVVNSASVNTGVHEMNIFLFFLISYCKDRLLCIFASPPLPFNSISWKYYITLWSCFFFYSCILLHYVDIP